MKPLETKTKQRLKVVLQSLIYLALVFFLLREVDEAMTIEECTGSDASPRALARNDYDFLIKHSTSQEPSNRRVVEVLLDRDHEPEELLTNYCAQREFTARLIDRLNELRVSVIALDKIYAPNRCASDDVGTKRLQDAIRNSRATIIRGINTELVPETRVDGQKVCLTLRSGSYVPLDVAEEQSGLLRIDSNTKLAPLAWLVRRIDEKNNEKIENLPTLSFVTARAAEPETVRTRLIQRAIRQHQQPYSTRVAIPRFEAGNILCGPTYGKASDWRSCQQEEKLPQLKDAVVIFGDHVGDADWHQEGEHERKYGVDLQANFVAAILDKRCYLPLLSTESNLLFIGITLLILHICFHFFKPLWRTVLIAVGVWVAIVTASFVILSFTGYLFTMWVQGLTFTTIVVTALHHWNPAHE